MCGVVCTWVFLFHGVWNSYNERKHSDLWLEQEESHFLTTTHFHLFFVLLFFLLLQFPFSSVVAAPRMLLFVLLYWEAKLVLVLFLPRRPRVKSLEHTLLRRCFSLHGCQMGGWQNREQRAKVVHSLYQKDKVSWVELRFLTEWIQVNKGLISTSFIVAIHD